MTLKPYQLQVLAGAIVIALVEIPLAVGVASLASGLADAAEGAGFLLCCAGMLTAGREVRSAFVRLGSDKAVARQDPVYMRARIQLQITVVVAIGAVGLVAARRSDVTPAIPLVAATLFGLGLPLINRATGWSAPP